MSGTFSILEIVSVGSVIFTSIGNVPLVTGVGVGAAENGTVGVGPEVGSALGEVVAGEMVVVVAKYMVEEGRVVKVVAIVVKFTPTVTPGYGVLSVVSDGILRELVSSGVECGLRGVLAIVVMVLNFSLVTVSKGEVPLVTSLKVEVVECWIVEAKVVGVAEILMNSIPTTMLIFPTCPSAHLVVVTNKSKVDLLHCSTS